MALITCPSCGQTVSDKAPRCPHCGMPFNNQPQQTPVASPASGGKGNGKTIAIIAGIVGFVLIAVLATVLLLKKANDRAEENLWEDEYPVADLTELTEEASPEPDLRTTIGNSYIQMIQNSADNSVYEEDGFYFLYDITGDQIPELWVKTGTCEADYMLRVYQYNNGYCQKIYETGAGHSAFYKGVDYILQMTAHMGSAIWTKISYNGSRITERDIFEEDLFSSGKEDYTEPNESAVRTTSLKNLQPIKSEFGLY